MTQDEYITIRVSCEVGLLELRKLFVDSEGKKLLNERIEEIKANPEKIVEEYEEELENNRKQFFEEQRRGLEDIYPCLFRDGDNND